MTEDHWNSLAARLGVTQPVLQAGMGGVATAALAAAVADAGGGGILGLYKLDPAEIGRLWAATAALTTKRFGINLVPEVVSANRLREQLEAVLALPGKVPFVTFFGLPDIETGLRASSSGVPTLIQVGTLRDAAAAVEMGADAVILQGAEAGGHHLGDAPLLDLLREVRIAFPDLPLIASGGIAAETDMHGIVAAGACAVLMGTAFVCARESAAHPVYKQSVIDAAASDTVVSELFEIGWPGRPHRVLRNAVTQGGRDLPASFIATTEVMGRRYPVARYSAAVPIERTQGAVGEMALYCGTSCAGVSEERLAADIVAAAASRLRDAWRSACAAAA